jgi:tetratricopeptide (TPR) repeat protein
VAVFGALLLPVLAAALHAADSTQAPGPPVGLEPWTKGLALLHASHTDEALDWFLARKSRHPDDVCGFYFPALVYLHFDVDGLTVEEEDQRGLEFLAAGIGLGQDRTDAGARYCVGALYGLRAEHRLRRSKYLGAAFDAKRARGTMLELVEDEPGCVDCRFWIGSYDYFADVLPGVIRFFRSLLFFPKGDKARGLATLHEVAEQGTIDRYNALWLLYSLYRGHEKRPATALDVLEQIRVTYPDNVDAWLALGWYHFHVATPPERERGIAVLLQALEQVSLFEGEHGRRLSCKVRVDLARAYLGDLRPAAAVETVRPLVAATRGHEERELTVSLTLLRALNHAGRHDEALRLLEDIRERYPESPALATLEREAEAFDTASSGTFRLVAAAWRRGREGEIAAAEAELRDLLDRGHVAGLVYFGLAGMYFDVGAHAKADANYRSTVEAGVERPDFFVPLARLRLGNLADLRGDRGEAKRQYRKASKQAGDHEWVRDVAKHYLREPFTGEGGLRFP